MPTKLHLRLCLGLLLSAPAGPAAARLLPSEIKGIQDALYVGNLTLKDLDYSRLPYNDPYRLPLVNLSLDHPLQAADRLMDLHEEGAKAGVSELIRIARQEILDDSSAEPSGRPDAASLPAPSIPVEVPGPVRASVNAIALAVAQANIEVAGALAGLTAQEREQLIQSLPQWATEEPSISFDFARSPQLKQEDILRLLAKADLPRIYRAAQTLSGAIDRELPTLKAKARALTWRGKVRFPVGGIHVVVAGVGDDVHSGEDAELVIDLGGNDRYEGRVAAGIGSASVLIDLSGDDTYDVPDASVGAGILGIGLAYDLGGNDRFRGGSVTFGAGLAGVGVLYKEGGDDVYRGVALTQGFGLFGIGALVDTSGDDFYDAKFLAQGAARTRGVGWLIDRAGNDMYRAGGLVLNSPLLENVHYSYAQGFASGYRDDATGGLSGGVGLLTDLSGDDAYIAESYAQAASYWFSLGTLYDGSGNDSYDAYHYAQGSAMHMTAAYLFDLAGDDKYTVSWGACFGIGHDYGVALFLDRSGNDIYAAGGASPATGNANGVGIFVDGQGDDRFTGAPASGNASRGSGSLAVFAHLNGHGRYSEGLAEGQAAAFGSWGVALDSTSAPTGAGASEPSALPYPTPGSQPLRPEVELEAIYKKANQWDVGSARKEVDENKRLLVAMGIPALKWMIAHHLSSADATEMLAFAAMIGRQGTEARQEIARSVVDPDAKAARAALRIVYELKAREAGPFLVAALRTPATQRIAAQAAGVVASTEAVPELIRIVGSEDRIAARCALVSLGQLAAPKALEIGKEYLSSDELPLRKAAVDLLAKLPQGFQTAQALLAGADERAARTGLEILSAVGSRQAVAVIGKALSDPRPGVRIQALTSLAGRVPKEFGKSILARTHDPDPLVQAVARRIAAGMQAAQTTR